MQALATIKGEAALQTPLPLLLLTRTEARGPGAAAATDVWGHGGGAPAIPEWENKTLSAPPSCALPSPLLLPHFHTTTKQSLTSDGVQASSPGEFMVCTKLLLLQLIQWGHVHV